MSKVCTRCKIDKPDTSFNKDKRMKSGRINQCVQCVNKSSAKYRRNWELQNDFGISLEQYDDMVIMQDSRCFLCNKQDKHLHVDHCHKTGKVRKLLCFTCNSALGKFKDKVELLNKAAQYLKDHQ